MTIRKDARYWASIESQEVNGPVWARRVLRTTKKKKSKRKEVKKSVK